MPELRKDPITSRWVIIATERSRRPSMFSREQVVVKGGWCPFCPGNESKTPPEVLAYRARNGHEPAANTPGWEVRVVPNRYPALGIEGDLDRRPEGIFDAMNGVGAHEVIIESPHHLDTLATMAVQRTEAMLRSWRDRILDLRQDGRFRYILVFKNHGAAAGATVEHPHSQLIALPIVPAVVQEEVQGARQHHALKERCIFCDILHQEVAAATRVVAENADFVTLAPYAPRFPFETWILPKAHHACFEEISPRQIENLARALKTLAGKLDAVLDRNAYNLVLHTSPLREDTRAFYHWHIEVMPRLTKIAGFEWGTGFYINPTAPEEAARFLREAVAETAVR